MDSSPRIALRGFQEYIGYTGLISVVTGLHNRCGECTQPVDLKFDGVAGLKPALGMIRSQFENTSRTHRPAADQIALKKCYISRCPLDQLCKVVGDVLEVAARNLLPVFAGGHD